MNDNIIKPTTDDGKPLPSHVSPLHVQTETLATILDVNHFCAKGYNM